MCFSIKIPKKINQLSLFSDVELMEKDSISLQNLFKAQSELSRAEFDLIMRKERFRPSGLLWGKSLGPFKLPEIDDRVLPGTFANVIVMENGKRLLKPMRYQVRPEVSDGETDGIYNARFESLLIKKTWKSIFMRRHALVPFTNFYEWVLDPDFDPNKKVVTGLFNFLDDEDKNRVGKDPKEKKKLITFNPRGREIMWAPCLWDEWTSEVNPKISFQSFALITEEAPKEIAIMGHDRCPIFLSEKYIDEWLNPKGSHKRYLDILEKQKEKVYFDYKWAF